jgi:hypothetical protein
MTFEKGRWVEDSPTIVYKQEEHTRPIQDHRDVLQVYLKVIEYYKQDVYRFRDMSFWQRLRFLLMPKRVIRSK